MAEWLSGIGLAGEILIGVFLLAWLYQLYFWLRYMQGVNRWRRRKSKGRVTLNEEQPPVSVIVCARNEEQNLSDYLPQLLSQHYPKYEVIVVDDGSEDDTRLVVERLQHRYKNLRLTFVPHDARVISSKKLAVTLAAKAAQYDYLLLTDADCRPESNMWMANMMQGFTPGTEVVLGFGAYFERKSVLDRFIQYDTLFAGMQYMGMAAAHHPYMGVGRNLAYRKDTFFRNNGFAGMLDSRSGDDDLFVNKVANSKNTAIVATRESVTWSIEKQSWKEWLQQKLRHLSVSPKYKTSSKMFLTFEPLTRALLYGGLIATAIICPWQIGIAAAGLATARLVWQMTIVSTTAHGFGLRGYYLSVLFFDIFFPLFNLMLMLHNSLFPQRRRW